MSVKTVPGLCKYSMKGFTYDDPYPSFSWKIENFDQICPEGTKMFETIVLPTFAVRTDGRKESEWLIRMMGVEGYLFFGLYLTSSKRNFSIPCHLQIRFRYSVKAKNHDELKNTLSKYFTIEHEHTFTTTGENGDRGYCDFIKISDLYAKREDLLQDNSLEVCVLMAVHTPYPSLSSHVEKGPGTEKKFMWDFDHLFQSKLFSDVEVKCEEKCFPCHKAVLSGISEVFRAMFNQQMAEAESYKVTIDDMGSGAMGTLLKYIYTGKMDLLSDDSVKLTEVIYGAEKYQLVELKNLCFNKMLEVVSEENIGELIETSQMFNADEKVKKKIETFVRERLLRLLENPEFTQVFFKHIEAFDDN